MSLREHHRAEAEAMCSLDVDRSGAVRPGAAQAALAGGEPEYLAWGPDDAASPVEVLATLGSVELEYAAIRRGAALVDASARAMIKIEGSDAVAVLDSLLTQKIDPQTKVSPAFLLARTGRIVADMLVVQHEDRIMLDVDAVDAAAVTSHIEGAVFTEDVQLHQATDWQVMEVHGPRAEALLQACGLQWPPPGGVCIGFIEEAEIMAAHWSVTGGPGARLYVQRHHASQVWMKLHEVGRLEASPCRTTGWYAFNMARVEACTPWWHIDYGPSSLPHETGVLASRVRFDKGCYPGQEVVARMQHLGHPKQILRQLDLPDQRLPVAGAQVFDGQEEGLGNPVGVITSSAPAPLKGNHGVALAVLRWAHGTPGSKVTCVADGEVITADVHAIEEGGD